MAGTRPLKTIKLLKLHTGHHRLCRAARPPPTPRIPLQIVGLSGVRIGRRPERPAAGRSYHPIHMGQAGDDRTASTIRYRLSDFCYRLSEIG